MRPREQIIIPTGYAWEIPHGYVGLIRDRSGYAVKKRLTTRAGVIDSDYRGEVCVVIVNEGNRQQVIDAGERIAQMIVVPALMTDLEVVESLGDTDRGDCGFGSTGDQ